MRIFEQGVVLIRTKDNYPYIYILIEPNVVFVYRIETEKYITISDLNNDTSKCETFEIKHRDDYEKFNHMERKPVEGRAFFVNQDGMIKILEEINKHIQKRRLIMGLEKFGAVHIVTSESAAGSLRVGLERPKTVIGFPDTFSIGPLWKLDEKIGQSSRNEWLFENINLEHDDYAYENKFSNTLREIEDIANNVPIYIWYGDNPDEQTGIRFFLYLLREKPNEVFLMNSTIVNDRYRDIKKEQSIFHTGQLDSKDIRLIFENNKGNKPLSDNERIEFQMEWEKLSLTKEMLRLWIDGEIKGVPENHYDSYIIAIIDKLHNKQESKDFIKTGRVIEEILTEIDSYIDLYFIEFRIRHLVYNCVLELKGIPKSIRHYSIKLR